MIREFITPDFRSDAGDWDESKHERAADGKFGSGGGSSGGSSGGGEAPPKRAPASAPAAAPRVAETKETAERSMRAEAGLAYKGGREASAAADYASKAAAEEGTPDAHASAAMSHFRAANAHMRGGDTAKAQEHHAKGTEHLGKSKGAKDHDFAKSQGEMIAKDLPAKAESTKGSSKEEKPAEKPAAKPAESAPKEFSSKPVAEASDAAKLGEADWKPGQVMPESVKATVTGPKSLALKASGKRRKGANTRS